MYLVHEGRLCRPDPCPFSHCTTFNDEHASRLLVFPVRILLVNTPFSTCVRGIVIPLVDVCARARARGRSPWKEIEREKEGKGDSANQCSGQNVAIGGWCSNGDYESSLGRKDVPVPPPLVGAHRQLYFSPLRRDTVFVPGRAFLPKD